MSKYNARVEFGAGAAIGTLLGLIMGLSASPVASIILGALGAGLLALLGIGSHSSTGSNQVLSDNSLRVLGFGLFCAAFLLVGVVLRTHDVLAPSLSTQERQLTSSNTLSASDIRQILLLKAFGLAASSDEKMGGALEPVKGNTPAVGSLPFLFGNQQEVCQVLRRDQYKDVASYTQALHVHGGEFAKLADVLSRESPQDQQEISMALSEILCK